jgi:tetratricopeptide (TPR) repeat protein
MKYFSKNIYWFSIFLLTIFYSCKRQSKQPLAEDINAINLKRGALILCGPPDKELGNVSFEISNATVAKDFNTAMALLYSFEYEEGEKAFAAIIDKEPSCAMAYWGVAMCNYHPLWTPPEEAELEKGSKALAIAKSIDKKTERESGYINALLTFYTGWDKVDHRTRSLQYEKAMEGMYKKYPDDKEAAIFYALSLDASADPADKTFANQKKAAEILNAVYPGEPNHPGIIHYIIHTYDYPGLAQMALPAARKYASVAPSSGHALHMPSHIFIRLGLWDESIQSNIASKDAAKCYAESAGIKGHWDEEIHAIDYLVYGYLQKRDTQHAKEVRDYLLSFEGVYPANFKVAYAFASVPARYVLENRLWKEAAALQVGPSYIPWNKFPWQAAITHFTRTLGFVHTNQLDSAHAALNTLNKLHDELVSQKNTYNANQVDIQIKTAQAWILWKEGKSAEALTYMNQAADMEDKTEKHPVTPGEVLPARELLADMLLAMNKPDEALIAYEADLQTHPNRFNGLYGAGMAAEKAGKADLAKNYFKQLSVIAGREISPGLRNEYAKK